MILAIVGLAGSGKSEAAGRIVQKTGWPKVHFGDVTAEGLQKQRLPVTEENERKFREEVRREHGMAAYAVLNLPKIKDLYRQSQNVIVESLYSWEEFLEMKKQFGNDFKVLAVLAAPEIRQQRVAARPERPLSAQEFQSRDISQIENLHQAGPVARADFFITNEGTKEELFKKIDVFLKKITV